MIFYKDKFFFAVVGSFAVGEVVRRDGLFLAEVADIFFVSQNFYNDAGRPAGSVFRRKAFFQQFRRDSAGAFSFFCIFVEDRSIPFFLFHIL